MGTHALVRFAESEKGPCNSFFYKHYDGYPMSLGNYIREALCAADSGKLSLFQTHEQVVRTLHKAGKTDIEVTASSANWHYRIWKVGEEFHIEATFAYNGNTVYKGPLAQFVPKEEREYFPQYYSAG